MKLLPPVVLALALLAGSPAAEASTFTPQGPVAGASVVGGRDADPGAWASTVALLRTDRTDAFQAQFCGGTLVGPRAVLTAAHCVVKAPSRFDVGVGHALDPSMQRLGVEAVAVHPAYTGRFGLHDLAVLTLSGPAAQPTAALAGPGDGRDGAAASIAGWGNDVGGGENSYPRLLQSGDFVIGGGLCSGSPVYDRTWMVCADTNTPYVMSACDGDSGGPLFSAGKLVGVVSFGPASCRAESYFSRVSVERSWLDQEIARTAAPGSQPPPAPAPAPGPGATTPAPVATVTRPLLTRATLWPRRTLSARRTRTSVRFSLNTAAQVRVRFVRGGRTRRTVTDDLEAAGSYALAVRRSHLARGRYSVVIRATNDAGSHTRTLTLSVR